MHQFKSIFHRIVIGKNCNGIKNTGVKVANNRSNGVLGEEDIYFFLADFLFLLNLKIKICQLVNRSKLCCSISVKCYQRAVIKKLVCFCINNVNTVPIFHSCRKAVERWLADEEGAWNWKPYFDFQV
jgi:hypothetical protein